MNSDLPPDLTPLDPIPLHLFYILSDLLLILLCPVRHPLCPLLIPIHHS